MVLTQLNTFLQRFKQIMFAPVLRILNRGISALGCMLILGSILAFSYGVREHHAIAQLDDWVLVNDSASWTPRAGLQAVYLHDTIYLLGGRTPRPLSFPAIPGDSDIWGDVWASDDMGVTWTEILATDSMGGNHWPARAYFQAVSNDSAMFVIGGQNYLLIPNPVCPPPYDTCSQFISVSDFFNDVWRSYDGQSWTQMTDSAGWSGRAGLSSVIYNDDIYVMGGSFNDDAAVVGGPPVRVYYNDVWKSSDEGATWVQMTDSASWTPRAGAISLVKDDYIYLLGGEEGFTCLPGSPCPPYFNDVWRTQDGTNWELVTDSADWASRPGHQVVVADSMFVLFGGFGLSTDPMNPFAAANPMDVWISEDGASWEQVSSSPWNAMGPEDIKYDFDAIVIFNADSMQDNIFTFGGDRETFNFMDPLNYLNIDNDVWRFNLEGVNATPIGPDLLKSRITLSQNVPNPFRESTNFEYSLPYPGEISIEIFDVQGRLVHVHEIKQASAKGTFLWNGRDEQNKPVVPGIYFTKLSFESESQVIRIVKK